MNFRSKLMTLSLLFLPQIAVAQNPCSSFPFDTPAERGACNMGYNKGLEDGVPGSSGEFPYGGVVIIRPGSEGEIQPPTIEFNNLDDFSRFVDILPGYNANSYELPNDLNLRNWSLDTRDWRSYTDGLPRDRF